MAQTTVRFLYLLSMAPRGLVNTFRELCAGWTRQRKPVEDVQELLPHFLSVELGKDSWSYQLLPRVTFCRLVRSAKCSRNSFVERQNLANVQSCLFIIFRREILHTNQYVYIYIIAKIHNIIQISLHKNNKQYGDHSNTFYTSDIVTNLSKLVSLKPCYSNDRLRSSCSTGRAGPAIPVVLGETNTRILSI